MGVISAVLCQYTAFRNLSSTISEPRLRSKSTCPRWPGRSFWEPLR